MGKTSVELKKGIKAHFIKTDLYKTDLTCIIITTPLKRETVTKNALIPFMLRRGTAKLPNQYLISKELENMYGATFNCGVDKMGDNVVLKFFVESISNEYALNNEDILKMNLENLLDLVFNPVGENGNLNKDFLDVEKGNLKDVIEIVDTAKMINECGQSVLIEGAQGQDLDINYGLDYPNITSRMCSASQLIADAGCSPFKVKDIYMIIRPYPIRISNKTNIGEEIYSGDYAGSTEITWEEVKKRCGCDIDLREYTTVTKKVRRVFEMNWDRLKYNVMINHPTQIVLNFAQYIDWKAYKCKDYNLLPGKVIEFINKIEKETNTPVTIIGTGECESDIIDLRKFKRNK